MPCAVYQSIRTSQPMYRTGHSFLECARGCWFHMMRVRCNAPQAAVIFRLTHTDGTHCNDKWSADQPHSLSALGRPSAKQLTRVPTASGLKTVLSQRQHEQAGVTRLVRCSALEQQQQPGLRCPAYLAVPLCSFHIAPGPRSEPTPTWPLGAQRTSANVQRGAVQVCTTRALRGRAPGGVDPF
jgi:hypothetical protein